MAEDGGVRREIELLDRLVRGCPMHPAYRGVRATGSYCLDCQGVYKARQELIALRRDRSGATPAQHTTNGHQAAEAG